MSKRFSTNGYYIYDQYKEDKWLVNEVEAQEIVTIMNNLDTKARERSIALSTLQKKYDKVYDEKQYFKRALQKELVCQAIIEGRYEKRFSLWKCNDYKNGVKDNFENAYYLDDEVVDLINGLYEENKKLKKDLEHCNNKFEDVKNVLLSLAEEENK